MSAVPPGWSVSCMVRVWRYGKALINGPYLSAAARSRAIGTASTRQRGPCARPPQGGVQASGYAGRTPPTSFPGAVPGRAAALPAATAFAAGSVLCMSRPHFTDAVLSVRPDLTSVATMRPYVPPNEQRLPARGSRKKATPQAGSSCSGCRGILPFKNRSRGNQPLSRKLMNSVRLIRPCSCFLQE